VSTVEFDPGNAGEGRRHDERSQRERAPSWLLTREMRFGTTQQYGGGFSLAQNHEDPGGDVQHLSIR
jgi:hypothetical protein